MKALNRLLSLLFLLPFLWVQSAQGQDCLDEDEYEPYIEGASWIWQYNTGETVEVDLVRFEKVPNQSVSAFRYESNGGGIMWINTVDSQQLEYRSCPPGIPHCIDYDPPWILREFPLCVGDEWNPHPDSDRTWKVVENGISVEVLGTIYTDCSRGELDDAVEGRVLQHWWCPCLGSVKVVHDILEYTALLKSYNICPDEDDDAYWDSGCLATRACGGDCDDMDPQVNPGAQEGPAGDPTCSDGMDNDCDGSTDGMDSGCSDGSCVAHAEASGNGSNQVYRPGDEAGRLVYLVLLLGTVLLLTIRRKVK